MAGGWRDLWLKQTVVSPSTLPVCHVADAIDSQCRRPPPSRSLNSRQDNHGDCPGRANIRTMTRPWALESGHQRRNRSAQICKARHAGDQPGNGEGDANSSHAWSGAEQHCGQTTEVIRVNTSGQVTAAACRLSHRHSRAKPKSLFHKPFSTFRTAVFCSLKSQECHSMPTAPFSFPGPSM